MQTLYQHFAVAPCAGWVREMYALCLSVHKNKVQLVHAVPPNSTLISQPPHDWELGAAALLHYTWGTLFYKDDKEVWRFEKRDWTSKEHERKVRQPLGATVACMWPHFLPTPSTRYQS
jgi:hypothetical protein